MILGTFVVLVLLGISNAQVQTDPPTDPPATDPPATDPPATDPPATDPPATEAPTTDAPATDAPATDPPATDPPATDAPTTDAPATDAPATDAPATDAPATDAPATDPPATDAPATDAPTTDVPATDAPTDPPATSSPPPDSLSVECTTQEMMVYLEHTKHTNIDLDKVTLRDVSCTLNDLGDANSTHLWLRVPFDRCMTNHTTDGDMIIYQNSIVTETRSSAGSVLISREFQAEFPFKCTYPRSAVVSVASFSPREKVIYTKTAEYGNFTFTMDMYPTDQYETPYDSYPVRLDLNDPMYLEVKVSSNDSQLVLIPTRCWGTASNDKDDDKFYEFIEEYGCKSDKDDTLMWDYEESAVQQFKLDAFRFLRENADAEVYLHCDVEACRKGDSESRCAKGCEPKTRKRRSLVKDAMQPQTVTIGPVYKQQKDVAAEQSSASSLTVIAAVAGVLAVVVIALTVALVMLYNRYRTPQNVARVVYTKASNDEGKLLV